MAVEMIMVLVLVLVILGFIGRYIYNAAKIITLAEATQKQIALAGNITEKEKTLETIYADRDVGIAKELAGLKLPSQIVMTGSNGGSNGGADGLFNVMGVNATLDLMHKLATTNNVVK